jgi:HAD superfamily phosphatase
MIVFDMDGVLVDVSESYRESICQTVAHFTGKVCSRDLVQVYKNRGGFNNDWLLSQTICRDFGTEIEYEVVKDYFNEIFFGPEGLMLREKWLPENGLLESLGEGRKMAVFTGRTSEDALITLRRFSAVEFFNPVLGEELVPNGKPAPDGLLMIQQQNPGMDLVYVGDTVDDARSSRAAGVPFIGIAAPDVHFRDKLLALFAEERAIAVVDNINQLPSVIPQ